MRVIEGVHYEWVSSSFKAADYIIFLDVEYKTRIYSTRQWERYIELNKIITRIGLSTWLRLYYLI